MQLVIQLFWDLLKTGTKFEWTGELHELFEQTKLHIVELVEERMQIFDMTKPTCLAMDWFRMG